ncbi:MAG: hypothetical protein ACRC8A_13390 [Microcoleaceae cyanobacterium]
MAQLDDREFLENVYHLVIESPAVQNAQRIEWDWNQLEEKIELDLTDFQAVF